MLFRKDPKQEELKRRLKEGSEKMDRAIKDLLSEVTITIAVKEAKQNDD